MEKIFNLFSLLVLFVTCGHSIELNNERFIRGFESEEGPTFLVSIRNKRHYVCTGTLLSPMTVLTVAHCFIGSKPHDITVGTGSVYLKNQNIMPVYEIRRYSYLEYNKKKIYNDAILLYLINPASGNISIINLDMDGSLTNHVSADVYGWGYMDRKKLIISDRVRCLHTFIRVCENTGRDRTLLCGISFPEEGACFGDSGGPLIVGGKQVGIVSTGPWDCTGCAPTIYTRVFSLYYWIGMYIH